MDEISKLQSNSGRTAAETFEGKRAILYKSIIQKIQILINGNEIVAKISVNNETLNSSEIIRTIIEINQGKTKPLTN